MHINLFGQGHSRREVKTALNDHYKRTVRSLTALDLMTFACVGFLARHLSGWDILAALLGAYGAMTGLRYFVDQSNRNFYLHRLDWEEAGPDPE